MSWTKTPRLWVSDLSWASWQERHVYTIRSQTLSLFRQSFNTQDKYVYFRTPYDLSRDRTSGIKRVYNFWGLCPDQVSSVGYLSSKEGNPRRLSHTKKSIQWRDLEEEPYSQHDNTKNCQGSSVRKTLGKYFPLSFLSSFLLISFFLFILQFFLLSFFLGNDVILIRIQERSSWNSFSSRNDWTNDDLDDVFYRMILST